MDLALTTLLADWALRIFAVLLILSRRRGTPAIRITWMVVALALPFLGALLYLAYGEVWATRGLLGRHRRAAESVRRAQVRDPTPTLPMPKGLELARLAGGARLTVGNRLELVSETAEVIERLADDIEAARETCHVETYIYLADGAGARIAKALLRAAENGVRCRLLLDSMGSKDFLKSDLRRELEAGSVEVRASLPVSWLRPFRFRADHRNHRKIVIIDGCIGWTGSQNIADAAFAIKPEFAPWVDVMVRLQGPSVSDLQELFVTDWCAEAGDDPRGLLTPPPAAIDGGLPVQIFGTGPMGDPFLMRQLSLLAFARAEEEIVITTPYFVPDDPTVSALHASARAGCRVVLVVPQRNDSRLVGAASRSYYESLLESGVEIHEYRKGLLHSKTVTLDNSIAVVASANLDRRSFELNYEVNTIVLDEGFTRELRELQESYIQDSMRVLETPWRGRGLSRRLRENVASLLAPLL